MIKVAVVEDETEAADRLESFVLKYGAAEGIRFEVTRFDNAVSFIENYRPQFNIVFMDVLLPGMNGMEAAAKLRELDRSVVLVFVTNMAKFAVKGYEVDALDFIVKPVIYENFASKMVRIMLGVSKDRGTELSVTTEFGIKIIAAENISYIEVINHDLIFHADDGDYRMRGSLTDLEIKLKKDNFRRCSVCYLVNMRYITEINGDDLTVAGNVVHMSRAKKKEFMHEFALYLGRGV